VNGTPAPDFLWSCLALMHFMRLSLMNAAYAAVSSAAYRKSGVIARSGLCFHKKTHGGDGLTEIE
jgi:hypothetical protein